MTARILRFGETFSAASRLRVAFVAALCVALSGCGYNTVPTQEESAKARWADVQNNYQRRADLIPNLVATVQGYARQERDVLTQVTEARAKATQIKVDASQLTDPEKLKQFHEEEQLGKAYDTRLMRRLWPFLQPHRTWMVASVNFTPVYPLKLFGMTVPCYVALASVVVNIVVAVMLSLVFNAAASDRHKDVTVAGDYA